MLCPFVLGVLVKGHQVEQLPHPTADTRSVALLQFLGVQVGGGMGAEARIQEQLVAGKQDFPHHVTVLPEVPSHRLDAQIVKTIEPPIPIILDDAVADMVDTENDIAAWHHFVGLEMWGHVPEQFHQTGLTTAHRPGEQDTLVGVDAQFAAGPEVTDRIVAKLEEDFPVLIVDLELPTKEQLSLGLKVDDDFLEIVVHPVSAEFPKRIDHTAFSYLRGVVHNPFLLW